MAGQSNHFCGDLLDPFYRMNEAGNFYNQDMAYQLHNYFV